jgi:hypothetical protein
MTFTTSDTSLRDREYLKFGGAVSGAGYFAGGSVIANCVILCGVSGNTIFPILCDPTGVVVTKT